MEDIIYLEPDEEITSVIDKIKQAKTQKIFLAVPRDATVLQSVVNLKLLLREANGLGKEISLVTSDKIGQNLASQIGLKVFDSKNDKRPIFKPQGLETQENEIIEIDMAQKPDETSPDGVSVNHFQERKIVQDNPKISTPWSKQSSPVAKKPFNLKKFSKGFWIFLGFLVLALLVIGFIFLPKVNVKIQVVSENYEKQVDIKLSNREATSFDNKVMSADLIEVQNEKEEKFTATGKKNLGGKAAGTITIYNGLDSSSHAFVSGTKLSSSNQTFILTKATTVSGATIQNGGIVKAAIAAEVEAENPGEEYNVKAGRFTIVGLASAQQEKIYGESSKDLSGGFSKEVTVVSEDDMNKAKDKVTAELNNELQAELRNKTPDKEILEKAVTSDVVETKSSVNVDQEAAEFTLKIKQRLRVMAYNKENFNFFVTKALEKDIAYDKMITLGPEDNITPKTIEPKYEDGQLKIGLEVDAKISSRIDTAKVKKDLLGKSAKNASDYLSNLAGAQGFVFNYTPSFWFKRIPKFEKMLQIDLEYINNE